MQWNELFPIDTTGMKLNGCGVWNYIICQLVGFCGWCIIHILYDWYVKINAIVWLMPLEPHSIRTLLKTAIYNIADSLFGTEYMFAQLIYRNPCIPWSGQIFGPNSTWSVQHSLNNADAHMPLRQDCPQPLINSTTGHYNSTCTHSTRLASG